MNPYNDMTLAARRARESRWNAKTCARVVHPRFGEVIVPHTSNYAAMLNAAEYWGCDWLEMNMELDDLPPRYRAQAEQQLAARKRRAADPLAEAVKQAKAAGRNFDSRGEYEFYTGIVLPKMARGEIVECEQHPAFPLFPAGEYGTMKLRPIRYTADFRLKYADGTVEIVEIKSKFVRRMQRDYPVRRRVFLEQIARPAGWKFTEIITAEDKDDLKRWRELAKEG